MKILMISRSTLFTVPGGDTVQVEETAKALEKLGISVEIKLANQNIDYTPYDLIHFFNVIRPNTILPHIRKSGLPYVVSTIYVDYSEIDKISRGKMAQLLSKVIGPNGMEYCKTIARWLINGEKLLDQQYLFRGHKSSTEKVLRGASHLLPNSENEYRRVKADYDFDCPYTAVPNAVNDIFLEQELNSSAKQGIVCVGRIERIKNQLNLIRAVNQSDYTLKIIGKAAPNHMDYYEACKAEANSNVEFMGQLSQKEVIEELLQAKVHVLPSWFETTGLSSLEAAALGCNLVITDKGDVREYFEDHVEYCLADDVDSIKLAIEKAMAKDWSPDLRNKIDRQYRWKNTAEITLKVYSEVLK